VTQPFPPDLPDLLRIACSQGKMRLHVSHSSQRGHQASLANAADGWTVSSNRDSLEAIIDVLRQRYGKMLDRQRAGDPLAAEAVHPAHRGTTDPRQIDIEEAIAAVTDVEGLIG
jgi:hypothetical protein